MPKTKLLGSLFLHFAKIGLFTFGGGYAMISVIENCCVERKRWITHDDMMNITVIAESTPGPIAINCATFVGYKQAGFAGSLAATVGMVLPSFVLLYLISLFFDGFLEIRWIANAFRGVKLAVGLLILDAAVNMIRKMQKKPLPLAILIGSCAVMLAVNWFSLSFSSVALMLICGALSLILTRIGNAKNRPEPSKGGGAA